MADILYQFHGTNGSIFIGENSIVIVKRSTLTLPLDHVLALEFQEGKFFQEGSLIVHTRDEKDHLVFEAVKDYDNAVSVGRGNNAAAKRFVQEAEEYIYMKTR